MEKRKHRVAYLKGDLPNSPTELLKIKTKSGRLTIEQNAIKIAGSNENFEFKYDDAISCEYKRRQMFGFIVLKSNKYTISLLIPTINLFNWFLITNFVATTMLYNYLKKKFKKK